MINRATSLEARRQGALATFLHTNSTPAPKWHADSQLANRTKSISTCSRSATFAEKPIFIRADNLARFRRYRGRNKSFANLYFRWAHELGCHVAINIRAKVCQNILTSSRGR